MANEVCGITGTSIRYEDKLIAVLVASSPIRDHLNDKFYSYSRLYSLPFRGYYDDFGRIQFTKDRSLELNKLINKNFMDLAQSINESVYSNNLSLGKCKRDLRYEERSKKNSGDRTTCLSLWLCHEWAWDLVNSLSYSYPVKHLPSLATANSMFHTYLSNKDIFDFSFLIGSISNGDNVFIENFNDEIDLYLDSKEKLEELVIEYTKAFSTVKKLKQIGKGLFCSVIPNTTQDSNLQDVLEFNLKVAEELKKRI